VFRSPATTSLNPSMPASRVTALVGGKILVTTMNWLGSPMRFQPRHDASDKEPPSAANSTARDGEDNLSAPTCQGLWHGPRVRDLNLPSWSNGDARCIEASPVWGIARISGLGAA